MSAAAQSAVTYWPRPEDFHVAAPRRARRAAPSLSGGVRKPLHLDGRKQPIDVRAAGPALAITRGARAFTLPLQRIARVLVCGRVRWDADALALCLQQHISIVFLDCRARPLGAALPLTAQTGALDELLQALLDQPDWRTRYDNWLRAQRMRILAQWRRERAHTGRPLDRAEWAEAVRAFVYRGGDELCSASAGTSYAIVLGVLLRAGVRSQYRSCDGGTLSLARDLAHVLAAHAALRRGALAQQFEAYPALKAAAEASSAANQEARAIEVLARLRRRVADWIEPWP